MTTSDVILKFLVDRLVNVSIELRGTKAALKGMIEERDAIRDKALDGINRMLEVVSGVHR